MDDLKHPESARLGAFAEAAAPGEPGEPVVCSVDPAALRDPLDRLPPTPPALDTPGDGGR